MKKSIRVLSIDGGGIRGIIPGLVLAELEKRSNKPISELFDFIAGTSTGSILALGLTVADEQLKPRYKAKDMVSLYENYADKVFSRTLWHKIAVLNNLLDEKYQAFQFEKILDQYFGDAMLKDTLVHVLIPAYDMENRIPYFFKSHKAGLFNSRDFPLKKVIRSATAAPTYFEPYKLEIPGENEHFSLIDGGVYANNPGMCALVEVQKMYPEMEEITFVSLGTGEYTLRYPHEVIKNWGLVNWPVPILAVAFDGISDTVNYQLMKLLNSDEDKTSYFRFQATLPDNNNALDNIKQSNIQLLKRIAEELIVQNDANLDYLAKKLSS